MKSELERIQELKDWISTGRAREIREQAGLSQEAVCRALGFNSNSVLRWESKKHFPHPRNAVAYHEFLEQLADSAASTL